MGAGLVTSLPAIPAGPWVKATALHRLCRRPAPLPVPATKRVSGRPNEQPAKITYHFVGSRSKRHHVVLDNHKLELVLEYADDSVEKIGPCKPQLML